MLKRTPEDGGFWQPMTGTPAFDESLEHCLLRELQEETGTTKFLKISNEIFRFSWPKQDYIVVELVYGVEVDPETKITLSPEHSDCCWCPYEKALTMLEKDNNKNALTKLDIILNSK